MTDIKQLNYIARIAHCGGLVKMSENDALKAIRKLTIPYFNKEETPDETRKILSKEKKHD